MSPERVLLVVVAAISIVVLPRETVATEHLVGDAEGWRPGINYMTWAMGREFRVGDTLVFNYAKGEHNVYRVTGPHFRSCAVPERSTPLDSGHDVILLTTPGMKWYICGVAGHCDGGQRLVISVLPALPLPASPFPAPTPSPVVLPPSPAHAMTPGYW